MRRNPNGKKGRPAKMGEPRLNCKAGVTLIELIMAMVILGLVAIPMGAMIGAQIKGMMESTDFSEAGNLARREMERLNNIAYAHADLNTGTTTLSNYQGYPYDLIRTVATVTGSNGAERKDITLTAKRTGRTVLVTLYGSITKNVTYAP